MRIRYSSVTCAADLSNDLFRRSVISVAMAQSILSTLCGCCNKASLQPVWIWKPIYSISQIQSVLMETAKLRAKAIIHRLQDSAITMYHCSLLSLLLIVSAYLVSGSPTSASIVLPVDDALSTYYCSDSPTWSGPSFFPRDCATALARFSVAETLVDEDVVYEFLAVGVRPQSRYVSQETPRKYTYGEFAVHDPQMYGQETPECIPAIKCGRWLI